MEIAEQHCEPCRGGVAPLERAAAEVLLKEVPGWSLAEDAGRISRTFKFRNFAEALEFVGRVGRVAEEAQHHPEVRFGWGFAEIVFYTHKIGGLHRNDFILAARVDRIQPAACCGR